MFEINATKIEGIKQGTITMLLKAWERLEVQPGELVFQNTEGSIYVASVGWVTASQIGKREVRACGFENHQQLFSELTTENQTFNPVTDKVVRVSFRYVSKRASS